MIPRNLNGSFDPIEWTGPHLYPGAFATTGNTVIGDQANGSYPLPNESTTYTNVATVPEPAAILPLLAALGCGYLLQRRATRAG